MSKIDKASIYVNAQELLKVLYNAQFSAPKRDRIALFNRMFDHCEKVVAYFALSYLTDAKVENIQIMMAEFEALKVECRMAISLGIVKREGDITAIRDLIAKMQEATDKWHSFVISSRHD